MAKGNKKLMIEGQFTKEMEPFSRWVHVIKQLEVHEAKTKGAGKSHEQTQDTAKEVGTPLYTTNKTKGEKCMQIQQLKWNVPIPWNSQATKIHPRTSTLHKPGGKGCGPRHQPAERAFTEHHTIHSRTHALKNTQEEKRNQEQQTLNTLRGCNHIKCVHWSSLK